MIAFQVSLNGERLCTAGVGDKGVLSAIVTWVLRTADGVPSPSELSLSVGGLAADAHLEWPAPRHLAVGDEVTVRIVEAAEADPPARERRDDPAFVAAQERKYFEHLKAKYGDT